mmetsp:Transcript_15177/g.48540  ORF Transcript_15177/g.48540 Transcript_15177/m.48540 type:complete len:273 (-) Transcript_15177:392-1210(-)
MPHLQPPRQRLHHARRPQRQLRQRLGRSQPHLPLGLAFVVEARTELHAQVDGRGAVDGAAVAQASQRAQLPQLDQGLAGSFTDEGVFIQQNSDELWHYGQSLQAQAGEPLHAAHALGGIAVLELPQGAAHRCRLLDFAPAAAHGLVDLPDGRPGGDAHALLVVPQPLAHLGQRRHRSRPQVPECLHRKLAHGAVPVRQGLDQRSAAGHLCCAKVAQRPGSRAANAPVLRGKALYQRRHGRRADRRGVRGHTLGGQALQRGLGGSPNLVAVVR